MGPTLPHVTKHMRLCDTFETLGIRNLQQCYGIDIRIGLNMKQELPTNRREEVRAIFRDQQKEEGGTSCIKTIRYLQISTLYWIGRNIVWVASKANFILGILKVKYIHMYLTYVVTIYVFISLLGSSALIIKNHFTYGHSWQQTCLIPFISFAPHKISVPSASSSSHTSL